MMMACIQLLSHFDPTTFSCLQMKEADDLEDEMEYIVQEFEAKNSRTLLHAVTFY